MDSIGSLIDKLIVTNIRICMAEDIKINKKVTDKQIAAACQITVVANKLSDDLIEEIDLRLGKKIGSSILNLIVTNIRIWMAEDIKRNKEATDKQIAAACRITNVANQLRNDLMEEVDIRLGEKNYGQGSTKMYGKE